MTELRHKIKNALDEGRTLILGAQVLLGFQFRAFFEPGFDKIAESSRWVKVGGLAMLLIAIIILFMPAAFHRIVERGEDSDRLHQFVTNVMCWALLPFALGFGIDCFIAGEKALNRGVGIGAGVSIAVFSLFWWYGFELIARKLEFGRSQMKEKEDEQTLNAKIQQVLTEIRMVLPGVQALLGFQMVTTMSESFDRLPDSSKAIHFASLLLIAMSAVLLMTPSAYHRLVEKGEDTEDFHTLASRLLIAAMVPLPVGIAGEVFVVLRKVTDSVEWSIVAAVVTLVVAWTLWFGFTLVKRARIEGKSHRDAVHAGA